MGVACNLLEKVPVLGLDQQLQELAEPCVGKGAESLRGIRLPSSPTQNFEDGEEAGTILGLAAPINVVLEIGQQSSSPDAGVQGGIRRNSTAAHQKVDKTVPRDKQQARLAELALCRGQRFLEVKRQASSIRRDIVDKNPGIEIRDLLGDERTALSTASRSKMTRKISIGSSLANSANVLTTILSRFDKARALNRISV